MNNFTKWMIVFCCLTFSLSVIFVPAFADKEVRILQGNINPRCIETSCYDKTIITIMAGETITWINDDVPAHTIVSGTPFTGAGSIFDSRLMLPETTYEYTFNEQGEYPYLCVLHPWATGLVKVIGEPKITIDKETGKKTETGTFILGDATNSTRTTKHIGYIGKSIGDGTSYLMSYVSQGKISSAIIVHEENHIRFVFETPAPIGDKIQMKINQGMILDPTFVEVNGHALESFPVEYKYVQQGEDNTLMFTTPVELWEIKIYGTQVVPEYGSVALIILAVATISIIMVARFQQVKQSL